MPLSAAKRVQFNFELEPVEGIALMRNVPKMTFPFLWIEEGAVVPNLYVKLLKYTLILYAKFAQIMNFQFPKSFYGEHFYKFYLIRCRFQRANWSIFIGSLIGAPVAAICSFILHLLIKHKKIQVITKTIGSAFKKVQDKITETVETVQTAVVGKDTVAHS